MKKILNLLAVSTLVGTSASTLKPVFTNNAVNHSFKSNSNNNKDVSIQGENDTNPFALAQINSKINLDKILVSPDGTIYAILNWKLNKSNDNGYSFLPVTTIPDKYSISNIAISTNGNIYLGTTGLLKFNTDGSFEKIKNMPDVDIFSLTTDKDGNVYAGGSNGIVYKSTDGSTFKAMSGPNQVIFSLTTDKDGNLYAGGSNGIVYKSTDGSTFKAMSGTPVTSIEDIKTITTDKDGNVYAGGNNGIVYKSTDGSTFKVMSGPDEVIFSLVTDKDGNVYAGTENGLYKSNGINEFIVVDQISSDAWVNDIAIADDGTMYVATQNHGLYVIKLVNYY